MIELTRGVSVSSLSETVPFGVIVLGLQLDHLEDAFVRKSLYDLWIREGVIVFEDISGEEMQLALSRCFGTLIAHPTREARAAHPELMTVRYTPDDGFLMDVDGQRRGSWLPWHSDLIYVNRINHGGILRPVKLPSHLGETGFIDKITAYDTLPAALKTKIEGLNVIYQYDLNPEHQKFGRTARVHVERYTPGIMSIQDRLADFPRVVHPLVYTQPETGRKVLNLSPWFAVGIQGKENAEGDALLEQIARHIVDDQKPYMHQWTMSQMVLWDNWRVLHSSTGAPFDEERWMLRTTIEGDYGLGQNEKDLARSPADYISI